MLNQNISDSKDAHIYRNTYSHVISLGFFCSVAMEIERIGLRSASYPFDWLITRFEGVVEAIDNHFDDFLAYENMAQHKSYPYYYKDTKYGMEFYHDFSAYASLESQLPAVKEKYRRRIERFYNSIIHPTLFLRYISSESEMNWIEENNETIIRLLKSYNQNNNIIWIANSDIHSDKLKIYYVEKDKNDCVARTFLNSNSELKAYLNSLSFENKEENIAYNKKKSRNKLLKKIAKKIKVTINKKTKNLYSHTTKYE